LRKVHRSPGRHAEGVFIRAWRVAAKQTGFRAVK
jgi:hypothetical protein